MNFITLSDYKFLPQGLALAESLRKYDSNFTLHYLCLDYSSYYEIHKGTYKNIRPYYLRDEESFNSELKKIKGNLPSKEALQVAPIVGLTAYQMEYYWTLASWFTNYLMETGKYDSLTYVDSDLYFFDDWNKTFETIGDRSVGFVRNNSDNDKVNGQYNVSFVYFKNNLIGNQALLSWKNWVCDSNNPYKKTHGDCGDQKYLELIPELFGENNVCILDDEGIIQLAPWNVNVDKQPLFFHFSGFKYDKEDYVPALRHGLTKNRLNKDLPSHVKAWYDEYHAEVLKWVK